MDLVGMKDAALAAAAAEFAAALPVLAAMAQERAVAVVTMLLTDEQREEGLIELRRSATAEQWNAICQSTLAAGRTAAIKAVTDRDYLVGLLASILVGMIKVVAA